MPYASGANYQLDLLGGRALLRVWRNAGMSSEEGAQAAGDISKHLVALAADPRAKRGLVMDMVEAPSVAGPKTQAHILAYLKIWTANDRPVAIASNQAPLSLIQWRRLAREAGGSVAVVESAADAEAFLSSKTS